MLVCAGRGGSCTQSSISSEFMFTVRRCRKNDLTEHDRTPDVEAVLVPSWVCPGHGAMPRARTQSDIDAMR
eukprot:11951656-Alexandrium_andersonii.AAC.1